MFDQDGRPVEYLNCVDSALVVMEQTGKGRASAFASRPRKMGTRALLSEVHSPCRDLALLSSLSMGTT